MKRAFTAPVADAIAALSVDGSSRDDMDAGSFADSAVGAFESLRLQVPNGTTAASSHKSHSSHHSHTSHHSSHR